MNLLQRQRRKQSRSRRALIFNTNEPYINPELLEQMDSDQKLKKQMDINISPDNDESASKGRLALSQQSSRFELPMDMKLLENLSPQDYIRKYCVISSRRQYLYQKIFYKSRDKSGYIPVKELEKALREVLVGTLTKQRVKELCDWLEINEDTKIDYKLFSGMAALAERILYPDFVTGDTQDIPEFQRDKIECADFGALSWKLNGIKVNPSVESLLKKIS
ncbi:uncharacterized protein LOC135476453 [Liolophura sinensis]|uniref:uncharacterized protein LOC135476453 n=1 Tax=Liolophura sinensis TaxID=3198878 RepID=UPI003158F1A8